MATGNSSVMTLFKDLPPQNHGSAWESLWTSSLTPWDRSGPSPPLADLLSSRPDLFPRSQDDKAEPGRRGTALVPGCGRGHDVLLLASFGYDAVGLDLAETAIREARANEEAARAEGRYPLAEGVRERGRVTWAAGDFFEDTFLREAGVDSFDIIFDYTFSCALPMPLRPRWAARMSRLLSPAAGRLVILQFPNGKSLSLPGPPWGVNSDMYLALLSRPGEEIPCDEHGNVPAADSIERTGDGLKRLELIVPPRTHNIGIAADGTITDRVSVWSH